MSVESVVFVACAIIVLGGGIGVVVSRNPVHAALSLVATLFGVAVLFLNQNAQLLAVVQVIVYTGAIVVLILFVIMLLGVDQDEDLTVEPLVGQRTVGVLVGLSIVTLIFGIFVIGGAKVVTGTPNCADGQIVTNVNAYEKPCDAVDKRLATVTDSANINQIGRVLFTDFAFAFELTAALLTIAVVGAVVMARRPDKVQPIPDPEPMGYEDIDEMESET